MVGRAWLASHSLIVGILHWYDDSDRTYGILHVQGAADLGIIAGDEKTARKRKVASDRRSETAITARRNRDVAGVRIQGKDAVSIGNDLPECDAHRCRSDIDDATSGGSSSRVGAVCWRRCIYVGVRDPAEADQTS